MARQQMNGRSAGAVRERGTLALTRSERDVLQRLVVDLEIGGWAARGFELDASDPEEQQKRRRRVEVAFGLLDDLGWASDDDREVFEVRVHDALLAAVLQWHAWQEQAVADAGDDEPAERAAAEAAVAVLESLLVRV
jgi:hypothetical protein